MANLNFIPEVAPIIQGENWLPIKNFEEKYLISDKGRVFSFHKNGYMAFEIKQGYQRLRIEHNGKSIRMTVHRLVATHFIPNPENKPCINHINSIRNDNRIENLEWCTHKENSEHAVKFGNFMSEKRKIYTDSKKGTQPEWLVGQINIVSGKQNGRSKPCFMFDANKVLLKEYESQNLCAKDINGKQSRVQRAMVTKTRHRGYYFGYTADAFSK